MAVIPTRDFSEGKFLVFGTAQGMVKKTPFKDYDTPIRADGIIAINIRKGDELVRVRMTSGKDDIIMISKSGHAARFSEKQARPMGRATAGVKGMNVSDKGNRVLSLDVVDHTDTKGDLLVVTENGYGKRTPLVEYPVKGRGAKGMLTARLTAKKGGLAGARVVREGQELIFISQNGMVQRNAVDGISRMGRATQGVRVMNLKKGDRVSAVALVVESENGNGNGAAAKAPTLEDEAPASRPVSPRRQLPPRPPATARRRSPRRPDAARRARTRRPRSSPRSREGQAGGEAKGQARREEARIRRQAGAERGKPKAAEPKVEAAAHRHGEAAGRVPSARRSR